MNVQKMAMGLQTREIWSGSAAVALDGLVMLAVMLLPALRGRPSSLKYAHPPTKSATALHLVLVNGNSRPQSKMVVDLSCVAIFPSLI